MLVMQPLKHFESSLILAAVQPTGIFMFYLGKSAGQNLQLISGVEEFIYRLAIAVNRIFGRTENNLADYSFRFNNISFQLIV